MSSRWVFNRLMLLANSGGQGASTAQKLLLAMFNDNPNIPRIPVTGLVIKSLFEKEHGPGAELWA